MADTLIKMILNNQLMVFLKMERCNNIVWANTGHFLREKLTFGQKISTRNNQVNLVLKTRSRYSKKTGYLIHDNLDADRKISCLNNF